MREAIGGGLLLNIVIIIIGVISAFLIGSVAYSKAYKAKNRIISVFFKSLYSNSNETSIQIGT